ncbi:MAG TPA: cysteine peptidase family C39 domain-containing protein, partial [Rhodanobacter sp.]
MFEEPLVVSGKISAQGAYQLQQVIEAYRRLGDASDTTSLEHFLSTRAADPWRASLWLNVGLAREHAGMYSDAIKAYEHAASDAAHQATVDQRAVGQRAVGELLLLHTKLGHRREAQALIAEYPHERQDGVLTSPLQVARQGLYDMAQDPEHAFECGWLALTTLWHTQGLHLPVQILPSIKGSAAGYSLKDLMRIARVAGHPITAVHAGLSADIPVPAVMHLRSGHYATVVARQGQKYHIIDSAMGRDFWASRRAVNAEASGDYLVSSQTPLAINWRTLGSLEAARIHGAGVTSTPDLNGGTSPPPSCTPGAAGSSKGMPQYCVTSMLVGLVLNDTPVSYKPPVGPQVDIHFTYNQQDPAQPGTFSYSNLGPKWTH